MARPVRSQDLADEICRRMAAGESLRQICRGDDMPSAAFVCAWARDDAAFREQYARARDDLLEYWADQIVAISDDSSDDYVERVRENGERYEVVDQDHINRSRLRVDTRKWLMSKLAPKKYGDRVTQEVTGANGAPLIPTINVTISRAEPASSPEAG